MMKSFLVCAAAAFAGSLTGLDNGAKMPVFKAGRRISGAPHNVQISYVDGVPQVLTPGTAHPEFLTKGVAAGVKIEGLAANVHPKRVRANMWRYADFDGDGAHDLVIGAGDWTEYGWDDAYDAAGVLTNGPLRGFVYVVRNTGTTVQPRYADPVRVEAEGKPLEVFGWPSPNLADWDRDGDLDILINSKNAEFWRQTGEKDGGVILKNMGSVSATALAGHTTSPATVDFDGDGIPDIVIGAEDGYLYHMRNPRSAVRRQPAGPVKISGI